MRTSPLQKKTLPPKGEEMKRGLKLTWRGLALGALAGAMIVTCALGPEERLDAQSVKNMPTPTAIPIAFPPSQVYTFGMVGIVQGQTARLNVVNPSQEPNPPQFPCKVGLAFLDSDGGSLKTLALDSLEPGHAAYLDLDWSEIPDATNRVEIRGTVTPMLVPPATTPPSPPPLTPGNVFPKFLSCTVLPTVEVFDNDTNKTTVILAGPSLFAGPLPLATAAATGSPK
jgi:hypothetical protein